jgi:hypothetical protein
MKSRLSAKAREENAKKRIGAARHKSNFLTKAPKGFDEPAVTLAHLFPKESYCIVKR